MSEYVSECVSECVSKCVSECVRVPERVSVSLDEWQRPWDLSIPLIKAETFR